MRLHAPAISSTPSPHRRTLATAALAAAALVGSPLLAGPANAASSATPTAPASAMVSLTGSGTPATYLLPTGDVVHRVGTGAATRLALVPTGAIPGDLAGLRTMRTPSSTIAYPRIAAPYLGHELDPSLFALNGPSTRRVAVSVSSATAAQAAAVPGLTVTGRTAGTSQGYLDAAGAKRFGQALVAQYRADAAVFRATGSWPRKAGIFAGVSGIRPAAAAPTAVRPQYPMHTVVLTVKGPDKQPLTDAFVALFNADDMRRYVGFSMVVDGEARVSLPAGHYVAQSDSWSEDGSITVGFTNATVTDDADQELVVDLSRPAVTPTISTPTPTGTDMIDVEFAFADAATKPGTFGSGYLFGAFGGDVPAPRIVRSAAPAVGTFAMGVSWKQVATDSSGRGVSYSSVDVYPDVPASLARKIVPATMARVDLSVHSDGFGSGGVGYGAYLPDKRFGFSSSVTSKSLPARQIAYLDAAPGVQWSGFGVSSMGEDPGFMEDPLRTYPAGVSTPVSWFKAPLTSRPTTAGPFGDLCLSCRTATRMAVVFSPWSDAEPNHVGEMMSAEDGEPVTHFTLKRDGKTVFDKDDYFGAFVTVPATAATYQAHLTVDRRLQFPMLAPTIETDLTFVSSSAGTARPATSCSNTFGTAVTACTGLPLLTAGLSAPVDLDDRLPARSTSLGLTVGHVEGDAAVTKASLEVRVAGTETWTPLPLTITGTGSYKASFNASAYKGKALDVRLDVSDAAGGRLVQTIAAAVRVATA